MTWAVHHADCLDYLPSIPADSIDALVTDPPYCSGGFTEAAKRASVRMGHTQQDWFAGDNMGASGLAWLLRYRGTG